MADAGYSSDPLRRHIRRQYRAEPVIDPNAGHKEWKAIYNRRTAVERLNGRLKDFYKLKQSES